MSKWEEKRLGDFVKVNPQTISVSKHSDSIQYVDISSVHEGILDGYTKYAIEDAPSRARRIMKPKDIIFSTVRPNLKAYYYVKKIPDNAICSTGFAVLRTKENANSRFIYFLVTERSFVDYLSSVAKGSAYPAVDTKDFLNAKIRIPDLPTQKRIADILSGYDDLIENNNRRIELLEKAAHDLYKEWFVRFRFPGHETVKFENGLPCGWKHVRLGDAIEIIDGDRGNNYPKQDEFMSDGCCVFLNTGNVTKKGFDFSNVSYISAEKDSLLRKGKLKRNDIVLTTRGTVGNSAFYNVKIPFDNVRINSGMVILRDINVVSPEYVFCALNGAHLLKSMELYSSGSAQPQLPIRDMKRIKIIRPTQGIMGSFTKMTSSDFIFATLLSSQNQNLKKQRDLLLPRLMIGKLEV